MNEQLKNEIKLFMYYLSVAILSGLIGFIYWISPSSGEGEYANQINIYEAWKHYKGNFQTLLILFVMGGLIRLIFVCFLKKR